MSKHLRLCHLTDVQLTEQSIHDRGAVCLARGLPSTVTALDVSCNYIGDDGLRALAIAGTQLCVLLLACNGQIREGAAQALAHLMSGRRLRVLDLDTPCLEEQWPTLATGFKCSSLTDFVVYYETWNFTDPCFERFMRQMAVACVCGEQTPSGFTLSVHTAEDRADYARGMPIAGYAYSSRSITREQSRWLAHHSMHLDSPLHLFDYDVDICSTTEMCLRLRCNADSTPAEFADAHDLHEWAQIEAPIEAPPSPATSVHRMSDGANNTDQEEVEQLLVNFNSVKFHSSNRYLLRNRARNKYLPENAMCPHCKVVWVAGSIKIQTFEGFRSQCGRGVRPCSSHAHYADMLRGRTNICYKF